jgi:hypothetical protein
MRLPAVVQPRCYRLGFPVAGHPAVDSPLREPKQDGANRRPAANHGTARFSRIRIYARAWFCDRAGPPQATRECRREEQLSAVMKA